MSVEVAGQTSLRAAVVEAGRQWAAGHYELVRLTVALDESQEWAYDGAPSCAHWVAEALDIEVCTAREWLRIGRALAQLPEIDRAFEQGRLSYTKVRALTRVAKSETEAELCVLAERVPAGRLGCALAAWQTRRETPAQTEARQWAARRFGWRVDVDGMVAGFFRLPPLDAVALTGGVDARVRRRQVDASADASTGTPRWPSLAQQRADALVELVREGGTTVATEIVVHVRGDGCTFDDGTPVADTVVERIAPTAFLRALVHDAEGRPINASGRRRHPSLRQRRVVDERDRVCVDCGSTDLLEYDHDPPYEHSRQTVVDELRRRCSHCHHQRHGDREGP